MSAGTVTYYTDVTWTGAHRGELTCGNGARMEFSAPPDAHGEAGVMTPEDAFVAAANTCIMLMFLWACERWRIRLLAYACHAEGTKRIELDRTEMFTRLVFKPNIRIAAGGEEIAAVRARLERALQAARKYSLVANSVKAEIVIEPGIEVTA